MVCLRSTTWSTRKIPSYKASQTMYLKTMGHSVFRILGTYQKPTRKQWQDEDWLALLHGLSSSGVRLLEFHCWALYVATQGCKVMLTSDEIEERLSVVDAIPDPAPPPEQKYLRVLEEKQYSVEGVNWVLGYSRPSRAKWATESWVRSLFLLPSLGVELGVFREWARGARHANAKEMNNVRDLDDSVPAMFKVFELPRELPNFWPGAARTLVSPYDQWRMSHCRDGETSQEVNGPPPPAQDHGVVEAPRRWNSQTVLVTRAVTFIDLTSDDEAESPIADLDFEAL